MSRERAKGTAFETAFVQYANDNGFPHVERRASNGTKDRGDIAGLPGTVIELKNCARIDLAGFMDEAEIERENDGADDCYVIVKRRGKSIAQAYAIQTVEQFLRNTRDT